MERIRFDLALRGCFAGNLFDLGSSFTSSKYDKAGGAGSSGGFKQSRANLPERPWLIDNLDEVVAFLTGSPAKGDANGGKSLSLPHPIHPQPHSHSIPKSQFNSISGPPHVDLFHFVSLPKEEEEGRSSPKRVKTSNKCRSAIVFVDNAGSDLVLGILPFVREMLKSGVRVVLAANEKATINDVTCDELVGLFTRVVAHDIPR